ncbi:MAG: ribosome assembly cofactor RimP [Spirochaetes bacterium]|nr:ribosome assembly cofactor RimP [Spirochaetota bacterium]
METGSIRDDIEPLLAGAGLKLVELVVNQSKVSTQVRVVVYRPEGTGINECSKAHKLVLPRLQTLLKQEDFHLEVASPGVDRHIKDTREYGIFIGRGIRLLDKTTGLWTGGRIVGADEASVVIVTAEGELTVAFDTILKARLDYSQEGA